MPELIGAKRSFVLQDDGVLAQANPISGTLYEVLPLTSNIRIISAWIEVIWTLQPSPLELHFTIDGKTVTHSIVNPVTATDYFPRLTPKNAPAAQELTTTIFARERPFLYENRSIRVQAETTGGTVQNLNARIKYATR